MLDISLTQVTLAKKVYALMRSHIFCKFKIIILLLLNFIIPTWDSSKGKIKEKTVSGARFLKLKIPVTPLGTTICSDVICKPDCTSVHVFFSRTLRFTNRTPWQVGRDLLLHCPKINVQLKYSINYWKTTKFLYKMLNISTGEFWTEDELKLTYAHL